MVDVSAKTTAKSSSVQRHVDRRIFRFSLSIGVVAALFTGFVYVVSVYPGLQQSKRDNLRALAEISCGDEACDTTQFTTEWRRDEQPDYVIYVTKRYLIDFPSSKFEGSMYFPPLNYFDTAFMRRFRQPASWNTPEGEVWRLYSRETRNGNRTEEILIGYATKAPWKILEAPKELLGTVDDTLKREADNIAAAVQAGKSLSLGARLGVASDGFAVVDASTQKIEVSGVWIPAFLPSEVKLPSPGYQFYVQDYEFRILETEWSSDGRVLAASTVPVGSLWWLSALCAIAFLGMTALTRALSRRYLRRYFALLGIQVPALDEALRTGEGQRVEFKRGLADEVPKSGSIDTELLKSIAAFANTNDGAIFVGIDDAGRIKGLDLDFKSKDVWERRVHQLARSRIKPVPPVQVVFEEIRGMTVGRISVARGEAPLYMLDNVAYLRRGSSDVQAQPDEIISLVTQFAY